MKRKLLLALTALTCAVCLVFVIAGCNPHKNGGNENSGNTQHEHPDGQGEQGGKQDGKPDGQDGNEESPAEHIHDWGEWQLTTPATCTEQGEETRVCKTNNSHKETRKSGAALGHGLEGNKLECSFCGKKLAESLKFELDNENLYSLTEGTPFNGKIIVPKLYNGKQVVSVGDSAFSVCESLEEISLPEGLTSIGQSAFYYCSNLSCITIPKSVDYINTTAFYKCTNLKSIIFENLTGWEIFNPLNPFAPSKSVDVENIAENAENLTDKFSGYCWIRSE